MQTIRLKEFLVAGITTFLLSSCTKSIKDTTVREDDFTNKTNVQFINAAVGTTRNSLFVDGQVLNYATIAYGGQFPASPNTSFLISPGLRHFLVRDTLTTSTQPALSFAENFQVSRYYTVFLYDTLTTVKQLTVPTNITIPADTTARVRFANFIYNSFDVPAVDIFSVKRNQNVATNLSKIQVTDYIPYASSLNDTLLVRQTGTTTQLAALNGFNPTRKRSYTIVYRGSHRGTKVVASVVNY